MKHTGVVFGSVLLNFLLMTVLVKNGWNDGVGPALASLTLALCLALILSKTALIKLRGKLPFRFRDIVITASLIFGAIASSMSMNYIQIETFGKTYIGSFNEPEPKPGSAVESPPRDVFEKVAEVSIWVIEEEIIFRWIILGSLLMSMSPTLAVMVSSLLFAGSHLIVPILIGTPEPGLFRLLPTLGIGLFCGIAFLRHGLIGSVAVHFVVNLCAMLIQQDRIYKDISVSIICASAAVTLILLPLTLWFTRKGRDSPISSFHLTQPSQ